MANCRSDQEDFAKIYGWHVYVVTELGAADFSKIGTAGVPANRLMGLQNGNPRRLTVAGLWHFKSRQEAMQVEKAAHKRLAEKRIPQRDWFACSADDLVAAVCELCAGIPAARRIA